MGVLGRNRFVILETWGVKGGGGIAHGLSEALFR